MKILIVNGSPKKEDVSVTCRYVEYMQKHIAEHQYNVIEVGSRIKRIEEDSVLWEEICEELKEADAIIWAFPVYYMWVPAQLKRFIELLEERDAKDILRGAYATAVTTSINFYDHTAHNYIHAVSEDFGMCYWSGHSAHMQDLLDKQKRAAFLRFMRGFIANVEQGRIAAKRFSPLSKFDFVYKPAQVSSVPKAENEIILLITDVADKKSNLQKMIDIFQAGSMAEVQVVNVKDMQLKGGCLGCLRCGYASECVYTDGFEEWVKNELLPAKHVVFAWQIVDRALSSLAKQFYDRTFVMNHQPFMKDKQISYLVGGAMAQMPNLRQIFEGLTEMEQSNLVDIVAEDSGSSEVLDTLLQDLPRRILEASMNRQVRAQTFLGVGGHKIFRDFIIHAPIFRQDHLYYKKHGEYDFPRKQKKLRFAAAVLRKMLRFAPIRKDVYTNMWQYMIKPLKRVVDKN